MPAKKFDFEYMCLICMWPLRTWWPWPCRLRRNAKTAEINRAYRKLAIIWHPDKHPEGEEKAKAEKKFMDIAAAKEVLTDKGL